MIDKKALKLGAIVISKKRTREPKLVKIGKLVRGKVFIDSDGVYKVQIKLNTEEEINNPLLVLEFTEDSFNLVGRKSIFSREKDEHNNYVRIVRQEHESKWFPGNNERFVPFAPNWIVRGYIVKDNGITKFDFKSLVGIDGYTMDVLNPEDD